MSAERSDLKLSRFLPYVINNLAERISAGLSTLYSVEYGLTMPEWRVIANLAEHTTLNARQIVEFTTLEKSRVSRAVSNLSARGLLSQQRTEGDNRAKDLALTEAGNTLYRTIVPRALDWERQLLEDLNAGEYRDLLHSLDKLDVRLNTME